jgi:predicted glycosyltransferase involved in capsule biosynthesis
LFCSSVFKKDDFEKAGGYDELLKKGYEDWDFFIRLLNMESKVHQLPDVHFYYRIKPKSRSTGIDAEIHHELNHYLFRKYQDIYQQHFENPIDMIRRVERYELMYKNSTDYKLGNIILTPVRMLLKKIQRSGK